MVDIKRIQQLDLNLLKVFVTLFQEQNMTRAAEMLFITPSAVSHAVKRLRDVLGDPLFERKRNKMVPTPACQRMAPLIIDTLTRLQQILQHWGQFDPATTKQHVTIAMHDALELSVLPSLIDNLSSLAPGLTLASVRIQREQLSRDLSAGHIDVALDVALPVKHPVNHLKLAEDEFVVMGASNHVFFQQATPDTYLSSRHLVVSNRPQGAALEDLMLQAKGWTRDVKLRCQNYFAAKALVASGDTLVTLPKRLAERLQDDSVHFAPLPFSLAKLETHMYWHSHTQDDAALGWLRENIALTMQNVNAMA